LDVGKRRKRPESRDGGFICSLVEKKGRLQERAHLGPRKMSNSRVILYQRKGEEEGGGRACDDLIWSIYPKNMESGEKKALSARRVHGRKSGLEFTP